MPSFYTASKLHAGVEYAIIVLLIMHWPCQAISKHAFSEGRERIDGIISQKRGGGGGIPFGAIMALRRSELVKLVFR
jgi:hypothetical protein